MTWTSSCTALSHTVRKSTNRHLPTAAIMPSPHANNHAPTRSHAQHTPTDGRTMHVQSDSKVVSAVAEFETTRGHQLTHGPRRHDICHIITQHLPTVHATDMPQHPSPHTHTNYQLRSCSDYPGAEARTTCPSSSNISTSTHNQHDAQTQANTYRLIEVESPWRGCVSSHHSMYPPPAHTTCTPSYDERTAWPSPAIALPSPPPPQQQ